MNIDGLIKLKNELMKEREEKYIRYFIDYEHDYEDVEELDGELNLYYSEIMKKIKTDDAVSYFEKSVENYVRTAAAKQMEFNYLLVKIYPEEYYVKRKSIEDSIEKGEPVSEKSVLNDILVVRFAIIGTNDIIKPDNKHIMFLEGKNDPEELVDINESTSKSTNEAFCVRYSEFKTKLLALGYETRVNFEDLIDLNDVSRYYSDSIIIDFTGQRKRAK